MVNLEKIPRLYKRENEVKVQLIATDGILIASDEIQVKLGTGAYFKYYEIQNGKFASGQLAEVIKFLSSLKWKFFGMKKIFQIKKLVIFL